jgi:nucleotide-binding universal stress UspA family protein
MFRKILVPVDFTRKNLRAVRTAVRLAADRGASVVLLHVIERVDGGDPRGLAGFYRKLEAQARRQMREIVRAAAESVDLIVMSSHRLALRQSGEHWGTISHKVGILSRCPVLLVK